MKKIVYISIQIIWLFLGYGLNGQNSVDSDLTSDFRIIKDTICILNNHIRERDIVFLDYEGNPVKVLVVEAELKRGKMELQASVASKKGAIPLQTLSEQIEGKGSGFNGVLAGINADFFNMKTGEPSSMVILGGKSVHTGSLKDRYFVGVKKNGKVVIENRNYFEKRSKKLKDALGAHALLVENNEVVYTRPPKVKATKEPRSALGISGEQVYFVVVDGRQKGYSNGITLRDLALLLKQLGIKKAVSLDGGGSSTLVVYNKKNDSYQVRNRPSGGKERSIANSWTIIKK